jgi:type II secretory pathway component PulF
MPFAELFSEIARSALMLLVAVLAIYLSLRLLGAIAKFVIAIIVIAVIVYFIFFATDIAQTVKDAVMQLPVLPQFLQKGV